MRKDFWTKISVTAFLVMNGITAMASGGKDKFVEIKVSSWWLLVYIEGLPPEAVKFVYFGIGSILLFVSLAIIAAFLVSQKKLVTEHISKKEHAHDHDKSFTEAPFIKRHGLAVFRLVMAIDLIIMGYCCFEVLSSQSLKPHSKPQGQSMRVLEGRTVQLQDVTMTLKGFGIVRPLQEICLSAEIKGRIVTKKIALKSGTIVKKGELLCEIDVSDYNETLSQLESEINRINEESAMKKQAVNDIEREVVELAKIYEIEKKNYERSMMLYKRKVSSKTDAETAQKNMITQMKALIALRASISRTKIEIRSLIASKNKAISTVRRAKLDIERSKIYSPFAGRLLNVYIDNGEYVNVGTKLFDIADDSRLEIPVSLNAADVAKILGLSATSIKNYENWMIMPDLPPVTIGWTENTNVCSWQGEVARIECFNSTDGTVTMIVNPTKSLIKKDVPVVPLVSGMYCKVTFPGSKVKNAMTVPWSAIQSNSTIFLVDENNVGREVKTKVISSNSDSVVISQGLENADGFKIVTQRLPNNVVNGSSVNVVTPISDPQKFVERNIAKLKEQKEQKSKAVKKDDSAKPNNKVKSSPKSSNSKNSQSAIDTLPKAVTNKQTINNIC